MVAALAFDPTPPIEVLEHLESERVRLEPGAEKESSEEAEATVLRLGQRRRGAGIDR